MLLKFISEPGQEKLSHLFHYTPAFFFDLFGTLLQTPAPLLASYLKPDSHHQELYNQKRSELRSLLKKDLTLSSYIEQVITMLGSEFSFADKEQLKKRVQAELDSVRLLPGVWDTVNELKKRNKTLVLISNLAAPYKTLVDKFGLRSYFDHIVFSCEHGLVKPQPEIYLKAMRSVYLTDPKKIVFIGNSIKSDYEGPRNVQMHSVLVGQSAEHDSIESVGEIVRYLKLFRPTAEH